MVPHNSHTNHEFLIVTQEGVVVLRGVYTPIHTMERAQRKQVQCSNGPPVLRLTSQTSQK